MVIIDYFRACLFDRRKRRAIKRAQREADLLGKKFLVLVYNKRPAVISMQGMKKQIRQRKFPGLTAEKAREIAIYVANPKR